MPNDLEKKVREIIDITCQKYLISSNPDHSELYQEATHFILSLIEEEKEEWLKNNDVLTAAYLKGVEDGKEQMRKKVLEGMEWLQREIEFYLAPLPA